jgi:hypothetical protein
MKTRRTTRGKGSKVKKATRQTSGRTAKRKVGHPQFPMQREFALGHEGRFFDLKTIFAKLNARYFRYALSGYTITWGRRRKSPPKTYFVFGTIQEADRVIRIHPLLDQRWVPNWFIEYVVYHEMLHAVVPDRYDAKGRRIVHHEGFLARERKFPWFRRAQRWEQENLARFLR